LETSCPLFWHLCKKARRLQQGFSPPRWWLIFLLPIFVPSLGKKLRLSVSRLTNSESASLCRTNGQDLSPMTRPSCGWRQHFSPSHHTLLGLRAVAGHMRSTSRDKSSRISPERRRKLRFV